MSPEKKNAMTDDGNVVFRCYGSGLRPIVEKGANKMKRKRS